MSKAIEKNLLLYCSQAPYRFLISAFGPSAFPTSSGVENNLGGPGK